MAPYSKPEIMSPAGHWPQLRAAIEAGADAVYFGLLKDFTARAKVGFLVEELPDAMRTLHARGVRGYLTFNTLVFDRELERAAEVLAAIAQSGVDAIIVQDFGVVRLARQIAPDLEIHGSTQMTVTSAEGARLIRSLGVSRVVLARELSLQEIRAIREGTDCELEMFVHGALCVSYSGQCLSSEAWGGRSANRGQCAQACRLPYEMLVDGRVKPLADTRYLLSPEDLYALHQMPEIVTLGVSALKIEGRYKDADYVALATAAYRKAVDEAWSGRPLSASAREELQLRQVYSRGFAAAFITGTNHQTVVRGRAPRHRGVPMGRVESVGAESVVIEPGPAHAVAPLKAGDGVVFDAADWRSPEETEEGGRIYSVRLLGGKKLELTFARNAVSFSRIRSGDLIWRTSDSDIAKAARPYLEAASPVRKQRVNVRVIARESHALETQWSLAAHADVRVNVLSAGKLEAARGDATGREFLREQLGRLGNTPYELGDFEVEVEGRPFVAASQLNQLRREAVEKLVAMQTCMPHRDVFTFRPPALHAAQAVDGPARLHLLVRSPRQLDAALDLAPASVTMDYLDLDGLRPSVDRARRAGVEPRVAAPRVLKPGEERIVDSLLRLDCALLVRSAGLLEALQHRAHGELIGDASLNAANVVTADLFLKMGLERLTPAHDLNGDQVAELARSANAARFEAVAYHHLPVFHTEHCVFCRFLSTGTSYLDCGRPCDTHQVELRDPQGRAHPVMADVGCRNTVFGAQAQEASSHLEKWLHAGIRHFRLEFVHETPEEIAQVGRAFLGVLQDRRGMTELREALRRIAPQGITEGSLMVPASSPTRSHPALPVLA